MIIRRCFPEEEYLRLPGLVGLLPRSMGALYAMADRRKAFLPHTPKEGRLFSYREVFSLLQLLGCDEAVLCPMEGDAETAALKEAVTTGDLIAAGNILRRPYTFYGTVVHGRKVGRSVLGIPTANLRISGRVMPPNGVYLSRIWVKDHPLFGVTNLGNNPTVGDTGYLSMETHILNFSGDLYGQVLEVGLICAMRPERRFSGVEELGEAIRWDVHAARQRIKDLPEFAFRRERDLMVEALEERQ